MIYRAQKKQKQNSLYYLIHVGLSTPSSPSRNSVHDWSSNTSIGKHVYICIMYLMSIETYCRSRPSDTVYNSAGFDHTTGVSGEDLDINARHSADAARADRQDVLTKVSLFGLVSFGNK